MHPTIYTEDHIALQDSLKKFCEAEINPHIEEWERAEIFPAKELFRKMGKLGFLGVNKPVEFGGQGLDYSYAAAFAEGLASIQCGGVPMAIGVQTDMATPALARWGSDELRREYAGTDVRSDELKEFYHNFDTTFLGLFPSFIGEFNRLLADDARIGVRRPGSLTTELRIFALVRLGITDTATIAALLHCSVNTVYSYRSRMRLRSLVPERDFEQRVQSIGLGDDAAELSGT